MKTLIPFLTICLLFGACKKISYRDTHISGQAINLTDGSPMQGYEVSLVETETPKEPFAPLIRNVIASLTLGEEGKFEFDESLSRRDRYDYTLEFDTRGESFATDDWQSGSYPTSERIVSIEVGKENHITLGQVPFGTLKLGVRNSSALPVEVKCIAKNSFDSNQSYLGSVNSGEDDVQNTGGPFMSGDIDLIWIVESGGQIDSIIVPFYLEHNTTSEYVLEYPQ